GIARCDGDVMATNPALRLPLQDWVRRFDFWMSEKTPKASEQLSIIFDFRRVAGKLEAETALDEIMATGGSAAGVVWRGRGGPARARGGQAGQLQGGGKYRGGGGAGSRRHGQADP